MRRLTAALAALGLFTALLTLGLPAQAAKSTGTTSQMWTTQIASAYDGSPWLLLQADRIRQPGNAWWYVRWFNADGSNCGLTSGQEGTQTGATWGPTSYTFAYAGTNPVIASLSLGESYAKVVGVTYISPGLRSCDHGELVTTGGGGLGWTVLDPFVALPWSVA